MKIWKKAMIFYLGGMAYVAMELLFRGWSHGSMFLAGGTCFILLGGLQETSPRLPLPLRAAFGSMVITSVELLAGLLVNRGYQVWDYRDEMLNFHGQICLRFMLLWIPVSVLAFWVYDLVNLKLEFKKS